MATAEPSLCGVSNNKFLGALLWTILDNFLSKMYVALMPKIDTSVLTVGLQKGL